PAAAASRVSAAPVAALAINARNASVTTAPSQPPARRPAGLRPPAGRGVPRRGDVEKVAQDQVPVLGGDALGMELNAVDGEAAVREPHDEAAVGLGGHAELVRQACALDHQRMVARGLERPVDAAKDAVALVLDLGELAMHL